MSPMETFLASIERRAYRTALVAVGQQADALDIVQDSMMKLVQSYPDRNEQEWPALFHRILHNRITDWHRGASVRWRWLPLRGGSNAGSNAGSSANDDDVDSEIAELADENEAGPLQHLSLTQDMNTVLQALDGLPWRQQQAFMLRAWEGFDTRTSAEIMKCSEGSVKTHFYRAQQSLKSSLESGHEQQD